MWLVWSDLLKNLEKEDSHQLEVALLTVVLDKETKHISNPHSRVQLWLLQQGFTQLHRLAGILAVQTVDKCDELKASQTGWPAQ